MATLTNMLEVAGGSFSKAEEIAKDRIKNGEKELLLDLGLLFAAQGKFKEAKELGEEYYKFFPNCPRIKFNNGWQLLYDGDFKKGMECINDGGRACNNFGNKHKIGKSKWNGIRSIKNKKFLICGEGGLGDEIINVRFSKNLSILGADVIVAASRGLMSLFSRVEGVKAVIDRKEPFSVYFDEWMPAMEAPRILNLDYETLSGDPYIFPDYYNIWEMVIPKSKDINVGLRWAGNPKFEHEQFRKFPIDPLFNLANISGIKCYSFQRDNDMVELPKNIIDLSPIIRDWEDTANAINRMDIMISSCTSVAHLSAAMGKRTWIIVPIMPYYLWARPGNTSKWYNSVKLFRQEVFGNWDIPLNNIKKSLEEEIKC